MSNGQQQGDREVADGGSQVCKVEGCERLMLLEDTYYRRYNVCKAHLRALELLVDGRIQRFCQQCGKFQDIADFDDTKRSCRTQLARHSLRRRIKLTEKRLQREQQLRQHQRPALQDQSTAAGDGTEDYTGAGGQARPKQVSQSACRGHRGSSVGLFDYEALQLADGTDAGDGAAADQPGPRVSRDVARGTVLVGWRDNGNGSALHWGGAAEMRVRPLAAGSMASDGAARRSGSGSGSQFCLDLDQPPMEVLNLEARGRGGPAADELDPRGGEGLVSIARPGSSAVAAGVAAPAAVLVADRRALARGGVGGMGLWLPPPSVSATLPPRQQAIDGLAGPLSGPGGSQQGEGPSLGPALTAAPLHAALGSMPSLGAGDATTMSTPFTFPEAVLQLQNANSTPILQQQKQPPPQQQSVLGLERGARDIVSPTRMQVPFPAPMQQSDHLQGTPTHWPSEPPPEPPLVLNGTGAGDVGSGINGGGVAQRLAQYSVFRDTQLMAAQPIVQDVRLEHELISLLGELVAEQERTDEVYGTGARVVGGGMAPTGGARAIASGMSDRAGPGSGPSSGSDQQSGPLGLLPWPAMSSQSGSLPQSLLRKPQERLLQQQHQQQRHGRLSAFVPTTSASPRDGSGSGTGTGSGHLGARQSGPDSDVDPAPHTPLVRDDLHMMSLNTNEMDSLQAPQPQQLQPQQHLQTDMSVEPVSLVQLQGRSGGLSRPPQVLLTGADAAAAAINATGMDWVSGNGDGNGAGSSAGRAAAIPGAGSVPTASGLINGTLVPGSQLAGNGNGSDGYWVMAVATPVLRPDHAGVLPGSDSAFLAGNSGGGGDPGREPVDMEGVAVSSGPVLVSALAAAASAGQRPQSGATWGASNMAGSQYGPAGMAPAVPGTTQQQEQQNAVELPSRRVLVGFDPAADRMQDAPVSPGARVYRHSSGGDEGPAGDGLWSSSGNMTVSQDAAYPPPLQVQQRHSHDQRAPHGTLFGRAQSTQLHPGEGHQQHPALAAPGAPLLQSYGSAPQQQLPSYIPSQLLQRLSLKLHGCSPSDLMPDSRATIQSWLTSMNLSMLQLTTRSGCALLIADVLVPAGSGGGPSAGAGTATRERLGGIAGGYSPSHVKARMVGGSRPRPGIGARPNTPTAEAAELETGGGALPPPLPIVAAGAAAAVSVAAAGPEKPLRPVAFPLMPSCPATTTPSYREGSEALPWDGNSSSSNAGPEEGGSRNIREGNAAALEVDLSPASVFLDGTGNGSSGGGGAESDVLAGELFGKGSNASDSSSEGRDGAPAVPRGGGDRGNLADMAPNDAQDKHENRQQVLLAASLSGAHGIEGDANSTPTALGPAGQVSGPLSELLRQLLGPLMALSEAGGGDGEVAEGQRLLLQLDDQVMCLTWPPRQTAGHRAANDNERDEDAPARQPTADGSGVGHDPQSLPALPAARQAAPPPALLALRPTAVVAGRATRLQLAVQLLAPQLAEALHRADDRASGKEQAAAAEVLEEEECQLLHLRFAGECLLSHELKPQDLSPAAGVAPPPAPDEVGTARDGVGGALLRTGAPGGVAAELTLHVPSLATPGLAFLESSCGDVLGPWLPLPVVPSEAVASEIDALSELYDRALLQPFLCDLGRLLMLSAAGACLEEAGYTDDWDAYEAYCELREAMPDAAVAAGRLLRKCIEWRLPECTALATGMFLALLNDPV